MNINIEIPEQFYLEEDRDGYRVSSEMKRIWAVELDLLSAFDEVCRKNEITYYASGGTILGAVRHKGYIPWDDDIDLMMHREDYDKLCAIGPEAFRYPYFFQTQETDRFYFRGHAQLRNSETTGILKVEKDSNLKYNQGIFIDIFPLDNVPDESEERERFIHKAHRLQKSADRLSYFSFRYHRSSFSIKEFVKFGLHLVLEPWFNHQEENRLFDKYFDHIKSLAGKDTRESGMLYLKEERFIFRNSDMEYPVYKEFEMLKIPLPNGYENILEKQYGDWRTPVKEPSVHGGVVFDVDLPYHEYLKNETK